MFANGMVVHWSFGDEYIKLDPSTVSQKSRVNHTIQRWGNTEGMNTYRTKSRVEMRSDGGLLLRVFYEKRLNPEVPEKVAYWGEAKLEFKPGATKGAAVWEGSESADYDGKVIWECLPKGILQPERERRRAYSLKREQLLRAAVLAHDSCCAITGETTLKALDAAHIIPVKERGTDVVDNAILLRADIHRLFDAGCFSLDKKGSVCGVVDCSDDYVALLRGKKLSPSVRKRVADALAYRASQ